MVGFRGLCQRKPMYFMLFNFGLGIEGVCVGIFEYLEITKKNILVKYSNKRCIYTVTYTCKEKYKELKQKIGQL